jgi:short-subunit dehydrogenase
MLLLLKKNLLLEKATFCFRFSNSGYMSSSNRLDVVIFGATGYTGQYVVEEMARKGKQYGFKWGIAGRTVDKLKQVLQQASNITGV